MLKRRIIGTVLVRDGLAVQSIGFRRYLPIGRPQVALEYLDRWGVDEIVLLHIDSLVNGPATFSQIVSYAAQGQVPLALGGGIMDLGTVQTIIQSGADKVVVNRALIEKPELLEAAAHAFGAQCVVASIDAKRSRDGSFLTYTHAGRRSTGIAPVDLARRAESAGAGEILLNSIDRDGSLSGYDLALIRQVRDAVRIPVIASGGAGMPGHLLDALHCGATAVAVGNFFHYSEQSVITTKRYLANAGVPIRLDTYASYDAHRLDARGRPAKRDDATLEGLRFRHIPDEVI